MDKNLLYKIALTLIPNIGPVQAKVLLQHLEPEEIFKAKKSVLEKIEGIGPLRAASIHGFDDFNIAEEEIIFIEKNRIRPVFISDDGYPKRLLNCYDSPTLLYCKGEADLNAEKTVAIVGTRNNSDYGKQVTEKLVTGLAEINATIISGLAFGIDAIAHRSSLKNNLATIGVLAHGLDQVYPYEHNGLSKDILKQGGALLSEFRSGSKPDKHNFPTRNRIVAGMCDAVVVIETGIKGGSMITAELANGYNKDVFAYPGKVTDAKSGGCNYLIKNNKAILLTDAAELIEMMNWQPRQQKSKPRKQKELFIELSVDEKTIINILKEKESAHIDEINSKSGLSSSATAAAILSLELQNVIVSLPGKLYRLD